MKANSNEWRTDEAKRRDDFVRRFRITQSVVHTRKLSPWRIFLDKFSLTSFICLCGRKKWQVFSWQECLLESWHSSSVNPWNSNRVPTELCRAGQRSLNCPCFFLFLNHGLQSVAKLMRLTAEYPATSDHHCFNASVYKECINLTKEYIKIPEVAGYNVDQTRNDHSAGKSDQHWLGGRGEIWQTVFFLAVVRRSSRRFQNFAECVTSFATDCSLLQKAVKCYLSHYLQCNCLWIIWSLAHLNLFTGNYSFLPFAICPSVFFHTSQPILPCSNIAIFVIQSGVGFFAQSTLQHTALAYQCQSQCHLGWQTCRPSRNDKYQSQLNCLVNFSRWFFKPTASSNSCGHSHRECAFPMSKVFSPSPGHWHRAGKFAAEILPSPHGLSLLVQRSWHRCMVEQVRKWSPL